MTKHHSTSPPASGKPAKPRPDYPLFAHATGRWAKKIRGRFVYFGPWDDPDGAEQKYLDQKTALHSGMTPDDAEALTIHRLCAKFLTTKKALRDGGELSVHSFNDYAATCKRLVKMFGRNRLIADLRPDDFEKLRTKMAKTWGVVRVGNEVNRTRSVFRYAVTQGLLEKPVVFGEAFRRPPKRIMRKHRAEQGPRMFQADEIRRMLAAAGQPLKAMILLGVNCGFGNSDVGNLPLGAIDLKGGWLNFARPKTGIDRRCPLWHETVKALREWLGTRPAATNAEHGELVFITSHGGTWAKTGADSPVSKEMRKLLDRLKIDGHRNFYGLRHTFQNIGDESRDFVAVRHIMGHAMSEDISSNYRDKPSDVRLCAVAEQVRSWLFSKPQITGQSKRQSKARATQQNPNLRLFTA